MLHQRWQVFDVRLVLGCFESYACSTALFIKTHIDVWTSIVRHHQMKTNPDLRIFEVFKTAAPNQENGGSSIFVEDVLLCYRIERQQ